MRMVSALAPAALRAALSVGAAAAACATMWWIAVWVGAGSSTAVLATVIALTLSRRTFGSRGEFARSSAALPAVGLVAAGVGWLLVAVPVAGAVAFVLGMSIPIWMRRFGERASRLGTLITLPFVAMLVAPGAAPKTGDPWLDLALLVAASVVAIAWVALSRELGMLLGVVSAASPPAPPARAEGLQKAERARPADGSVRTPLPASTRMALQMAAALSAAFVVGWLAFPEHAMWTVLTAFIVCSGNRGRGDVVYKSGQRVAGALAGTVVAVALSFVVEPTGFGAVVVIFAALFVGSWLRDVSYAFWALTITLVLTLLQGVLGTTPAAPASLGWMLAERMLAIVVGALIGIAASWFILPVRSSDVVRRRLADALLALTGVLAPSSDDPDAPSRAERIAAFRAAIDRLEQLAPTQSAHRMLRRGLGRATAHPSRPAHPIDCIRVAASLPAALDSPAPRSRAGVGAALRDARRSLAAPADFDRIHTALVALRAQLDPPSPLPGGNGAGSL